MAWDASNSKWWLNRRILRTLLRDAWVLSRCFHFTFFIPLATNIELAACWFPAASASNTSTLFKMWVFNLSSMDTLCCFDEGMPAPGVHNNWIWCNVLSASEAASFFAILVCGKVPLETLRWPSQQVNLVSNRLPRLSWWRTMDWAFRSMRRCKCLAASAKQYCIFVALWKPMPWANESRGRRFQRPSRTSSNSAWLGAAERLTSFCPPWSANCCWCTHDSSCLSRLHNCKALMLLTSKRPQDVDGFFAQSLQPTPHLPATTLEVSQRPCNDLTHFGFKRL